MWYGLAIFNNLFAGDWAASFFSFWVLYLPLRLLVEGGGELPVYNYVNVPYPWVWVAEYPAQSLSVVHGAQAPAQVNKISWNFEHIFFNTCKQFLQFLRTVLRPTLSHCVHMSTWNYVHTCCTLGDWLRPSADTMPAQDRSEIFRVCVLNLRSCHLRLTLGEPLWAYCSYTVIVIGT
jgi:hypothetical protein